MHLKTFITLSLVFALTACFRPDTTSVNRRTPTPDNTSVSEERLNTNNSAPWQTYTYQPWTFSFSYPADWEVIEEKVAERLANKRFEHAQLILTLRPKQSRPSQDRSTNQKLELIILANPNRIFTDEFAQFWYGSEDVRKQTNLINSLLIHRYGSRDRAQSTTALIFVDSSLLVLEDPQNVFQGNIFDKILATFRFGGGSCGIAHDGTPICGRQ